MQVIRTSIIEPTSATDTLHAAMILNDCTTLTQYIATLVYENLLAILREPPSQ